MPFVDALLIRTMQEYVRATWPDDTKAWFDYFKLNTCNPANTRIVEINGKVIGRLSTTVKDDCVFIDEIHFFPNWQRKGIGTELIKKVFEEARELGGLPVCLTVLEKNPAKKLYKRMGFIVAGIKDHRLHMTYEGSARRPNTPTHAAKA